MCIIMTDTMLVNTQHVAMIEIADYENESVLEVAFGETVNKKIYFMPVFQAEESFLKEVMKSIAQNWNTDAVITLSPKTEGKEKEVKNDEKHDDTGDARETS